MLNMFQILFLSSHFYLYICFDNSFAYLIIIAVLFLWQIENRTTNIVEFFTIFLFSIPIEDNNISTLLV